MVTFVISASSEQRLLDEIVVQEVTQLRLGIGVLTKYFVAFQVKEVNVMGSQGRSHRSYYSDYDEEVKYLDKEVSNS